MSSPIMTFIPTTRDFGDRERNESFVRAALNAFIQNESFVPRAGSGAEQALPASELGALASVGLIRTPDTTVNADAAREATLSAFIHALRSSLSTKEVAQMLGVSPSTIRRRASECSLIPLTVEPTIRFPAAWVEGTQKVPGLRTVLPALPSDLRPLEALTWWLLPTSELADADDIPKSPRAYLLAEGDPERVAALAAELARGQAA